MATIIKIHPIDFDTDVAVGIGLPMMHGVGSSFNQTYTTLQQAIANAKNLLLTARGERVMQPTFGCRLRELLFNNIDDSVLLEVESDIRNSFELWLPYIVIDSLAVVFSEVSRAINVSLSFHLEGNPYNNSELSLDINLDV